MQSSFKACLFGASPGTGNQGVNALCWSVLAGMRQRGANDLHVFDYGNKRRSATFNALRYTLHGMTVGKRVWHTDHLGLARLAVTLGIRRGGLLSVLSDSDLVLDVSGGDSFTDLYGNARFRQIIAPKEIALGLGKRLVLLPQTYGPFSKVSNRRVARRLLGGATLAYARDPESFERLQALLADRFDPARHRPGVDLAFGLPAREPVDLEERVAKLLTADRTLPVFGLNVSGLISNQPEAAASRFGLAGDYRELIQQLVIRLLDETGGRLLLVPHVHAPPGHYESDLNASRALLERLPDHYQKEAKERIVIVSQALDACELKWLIAQCDWFCGTRMHATIAGLSSGVPTAALAYSVKTRGVFSTCAVEGAVVDLRHHSNVEALDRLMELCRRRAETASTLHSSVPRVIALAEAQLDEIANCAHQDGVAGDAVRC